VWDVIIRAPNAVDICKKRQARCEKKAGVFEASKFQPLGCNSQIPNSVIRTTRAT
jgi:hypothetical protein